MTTTTIPDDIRAEIYEEAGPSANAAVTEALKLWESGDHVAALRVMFRDGADEVWLTDVAGLLGVAPAAAEALVEEATL